MDTKYIGMDVHKETIAIAVMNSAGKLVIESILETEAMTILQFAQAPRNSKKEPGPLGCTTFSSLTSRKSWCAIHAGTHC